MMGMTGHALRGTELKRRGGKAGWFTDFSVIVNMSPVGQSYFYEFEFTFPIHAYGSRITEVSYSHKLA